ncbi:hypothetical protein ACH5RR_039157 [Cinchona calisaya]|uniref:PWWP domain-containing protein n=1 Tax=Cinchona calisaya TaxID=153742 RepID=A0ABD2Y0W5_9GENT
MVLAAGSLVWVQRKNGTWWPGKVVGLDEISSSYQLLSSSNMKTPIKLLGRENASVEWHNSETSKRVKAFRSAEFDGFIKNAQSVQGSPTIKNAKYVHREDAVLHALQLEKQDQERSLKTPGNVKQGALCRAKRSRCIYLPVESNHSAEQSVLLSPSLKVSPSACVSEDRNHMSSLSAKKASSESRVSDFSKSSFEDNDRNGVEQHTGSYGNERRKRSMDLQMENLSYSSESSLESKIAGGAGSQNWNLNEHPYIRNSRVTPNTVINAASSAVSRKQTRKIHDVLVLDTPYKSAEHLALEVKRLFHSPSVGNYLEDSDSLCFDPVYADYQNTMEAMLMDVDITVQANYRKEHVPLVSLMSKLNKKAIIGHPIEVVVLKENPEVFIVRKDSVNHMVDNAEFKGHQLVWRTSKRTPVCYITNPNSHAPDEKGEQASKAFGNSNLEVKTNNIVQEEESLLNPPKNGNFSGQNGYNVQITNKSSKEVSLVKQGGILLQGATCVPVKLIFTKLFFAVGI